MDYDVIIIGGGLGGLTAGAKLSKEGKSVLLLEQHDRPGGCATTFKRKDFTMEVGLHEMDGLHPGDLKTRIFRDLGVFSQVEFLELPEFYRFVNTRQDIVIPHDADAARDILKQAFPTEHEGIDSYFYHLLNARKIVAGMKGKPARSTGEFLDEIIGDEDLKLVLLGNLGYFHDDPYSLSLPYYLTAQGSYYSGRANFIRGGSQQLSNALASVINSDKGAVKLNSLATKILFDGNRVCGVIYRGNKGRDEPEHTASAREIIVNAAVPTLAADLLPEERGKVFRELTGDIETGASLLTVYYGFRKSLMNLGHRYYSTFVFDESVKTQADIVNNNHSGFETRSFAFVDYSQVDSRLAPEGKSVGAACCIDYASGWEGLEHTEYLEKKGQVARIITERCSALLPGFSEAVECMEVGTPLTIQRYTLNPGGAVYGFAQVPGKPSGWLASLPENLYIASAWGKFGGGFSGAIFSGYMAALDILRKR